MANEKGPLLTALEEVRKNPTIASQALAARSAKNTRPAAPVDGLDLNVDKAWFEKKAAQEGDLEIGVGRRTSTVNLTSEEIAELERLAFEALPQWAQDELTRLRASKDTPVDGLERYELALKIEKGVFLAITVPMGGGEYVRFDQAEAILVAERAHSIGLAHDLAVSNQKRRDLETGNAALTARVKELEAERYNLAYAITGGEDAPGYLDSLSVETLAEVARDNTRRWFAETDRAEALETQLAAATDLLREAFNELSDMEKLAFEFDCMDRIASFLATRAALEGSNAHI